MVALNVNAENYSRIARALSTKAILLNEWAAGLHSSNDFSLAKAFRSEALAHTALARDLRTQKGGN